MFGFSLTKILFTIAAVLVVWYGFKWVSRIQAQRQAQANEVLRDAGRKSPSGRREAGAPTAEDMVRCRVCGDYVAAGAATACGQADCPYPG